MKYKHEISGNTRLIVLLIVCMTGVAAYYGFKMFKGTRPDGSPVGMDSSQPPAVESLLETAQVEGTKPDASESVTDGEAGKRQVRWDDGSAYDGQLAGGLRNGDGVYTWASGSKYEGSWVKDKRQGKGVYTWPDGTSYNGEWNEDRPCGTGVCTWVSGSVYQGEWSDGKRDGKGVYRWSDGTVYEGLWQDDKRIEEVDDAVTNEADSQVVQLEQKSMLWKLHGEKNIVYMLGSIHLLKQEHYPLNKTIDQAFADSQVVVFEVNPAELTSPETQRMMLSLASLPEGQTLQNTVSVETFKKLTEECAQMGIHVGGLNLFKPWFVAITLVAAKVQAMGFSSEYGIEMSFYKKAKEESKVIEGLETVEFQLKLFDKLEGKDKNLLLLQTLDDLELMEENLNDIIDNWKNGNQKVLSDLLLESFEKYPGIQEELVDKRNSSWVVKIEEYLKSDKNYMVIGGALHFPGEKGVLSLLKNKGYYPEQL